MPFLFLPTQIISEILPIRAYACYISVAPFPYSSGTSIRKRTSVSKIGRLELKGILTMAARSAIIHDPELRRYFKRKFNGKKDLKAITDKF